MRQPPSPYSVACVINSYALSTRLESIGAVVVSSWVLPTDRASLQCRESGKNMIPRNCKRHPSANRTGQEHHPHELPGPQSKGGATEANRRQTIDPAGRSQEMKLTRYLRNVPIAVAILGLFPSLHLALAAESWPDNKPVLRVPATESKPVVDGKLEELCWKDAAKTGPLAVTVRESVWSTTEAFILRDAEHLYVGVFCAGNDASEGMDRRHTSSFTTGRIAEYAKLGVDKLLAAHWAGKPLEPSKEVEFVELLIDSNGDGNSYYLIRITPEDGGRLACSYNEHAPPWCDRTWQPKFKSAVAKGTGAWAAEFALPLNIFNKNKTLSSEIGFNIRRSGMPGGETHCWQGTFANPGHGGTLTGIPVRERLPKPEYVKPYRNYRVPPKSKRSFLAEEERRTLRLGPGSTHPDTTGEVKLELEGFLLAGDPHARGFIWDLAVDEQNGELFVLFDARLARGLAELRVYDRQGEYLRTIMPLNPNLPHSSVRDLCRNMAREGGAELVIPILFPAYSEFSMYGDFWHLPQKMTLAPGGDLIMSNIYRGTLWRMKPDGSLPQEGWTSIYHRGRNEPFESAFWTQDLRTNGSNARCQS